MVKFMRCFSLKGASVRIRLSIRRKVLAGRVSNTAAARSNMRLASRVSVWQAARASNKTNPKKACRFTTAKNNTIFNTAYPLLYSARPDPTRHPCRLFLINARPLRYLRHLRFIMSFKYVHSTSISVSCIWTPAETPCYCLVTCLS